MTFFVKPLHRQDISNTSHLLHREQTLKKKGIQPHYDALFNQYSDVKSKEKSLKNALT
jgi:hypothetical protein